MTAGRLSSPTIGLAEGWLGDVSSHEVNAVSNLSLNGNWWWPYDGTYYRPYYVPITTYQPVKILLSTKELDKLRSAAAADPELKQTLQKFTPYIEVTVEF